MLVKEPRKKILNYFFSKLDQGSIFLSKDKLTVIHMLISASLIEWREKKEKCVDEENSIKIDAHIK